MDNISIQNITYDYVKQHISVFLDIISDGLNEYWGEQEFLNDLPKKWDSSVVLIINSSIVGFIISSYKNDCFHIHKFFIHKKYRNYGYGELLLHEFETRIKQNFDIHTISLKVYKENLKAIHFYKNQNFIENQNQDSLLLLTKKI